MPYATVALVKQIGGLNAADDYLLFRYDSADELDAAITRQLGVVAAGLTEDIPDIYTAPTSGQELILAEGEAYLALSLLCMGLKSRKVFGTHWPLDQEGSDRFAELIDNEFEQRAQDLLGRWLTVTATPNAFARPGLIIGRAVDRVDDPLIDTEAEQIEIIAERARSLTGVL